MLQAGYEIKLYHPEYLHQVIKVLSYLWGENNKQNLSYFQWKYHDNPYTDDPLGVVCLYEGDVIGFRGYFATKWHIQDKHNDLYVLCPGDTCVHPDHRLKKLSLIMGNRAMQEYEDKYKLFLNFSSTKRSVRGYLKMGFLPLIDKAYINRDNILLIMSYIMSVNKNVELHEGKITFGEFDEIVVTDSPKPYEMAAIVDRNEYTLNKITLSQDEKFFNWRYGNCTGKYIFYFYRRDNIITGYVVIKVSENNKRGFIVDFSADETTAVEKILGYVIKMKHYDIISIINYSLNDSISGLINKLQFKENSLTRRMEKRGIGEWPLFVRPVKHDYSEKDFIIENLDTRNIKNWSLKEICSDGA
jgi:hypothetical protein